jgi:hypothetical protein
MPEQMQLWIRSMGFSKTHGKSISSIRNWDIVSHWIITDIALMNPYLYIRSNPKMKSEALNA